METHLLAGEHGNDGLGQGGRLPRIGKVVLHGVEGIAGARRRTIMLDCSDDGAHQRWLLDRLGLELRLARPLGCQNALVVIDPGLPCRALSARRSEIQCNDIAIRVDALDEQKGAANRMRFLDALIELLEPRRKLLPHFPFQMLMGVLRCCRLRPGRPRDRVRAGSERGR